VPEGARNLTLRIFNIVYSIEARVSPMKSACFRTLDFLVIGIPISAQVHRDFDYSTSFIPWFPYF